MCTGLISVSLDRAFDTANGGKNIHIWNFMEQMFQIKEQHSWSTISEAPSTLIRFQTKTELFSSDTVIVHTTTPKTITENGAIRKRSPEWSDLKTLFSSVNGENDAI